MDLLGPIRRLLAARRTREWRQPEDARIPFQARTVAGVYVTPDRALTNAVVWACVRYLSTTVAQLPWRVMRELPGGGAEIVARHPTDTVLAWRVNPELGPFQFKETMVAHALLWGNGYAEIVRDKAGRVVELWPIHPDRVEVKRDTATDALVYEISEVAGGGANLFLAPTDVFHLRGFGNGPVGLSVVEYAAQSIGWAQAAELFGAGFFGNGLNMGGFIEVGTGLSPEGKERLLAELDRRFRGPRKSNRWGILDAGMKANRLTAAPNEAQFVETMQFQVETICRWFGVPPHKVMHLLRSTNNNIEHQAIEVVVDSVAPWCNRLEEEANFKLFGSNRQGFFTRIDMRELLRGDTKARIEYLRGMREMGAFDTDEVRLFEGENPIGGDAGKLRVMQGQYVPLDRIANPPEPVAAPAAAPAPAEADDLEDDAEDSEDDAPDGPSEADMAALNDTLVRAMGGVHAA